ncbi:asparagine synthase (glutamine-hydrolyzing) [Chitinophagaceae bacterium IBVUCB1]|nr:asparagine synthase (glutamine-hydrolyzing) [Chitinophagaceae bacterium IBVUCB1]
MCGIAGIVGTGGIFVEDVVSMTDAIAHRGPDGAGHWANSSNSVCLGHRRLSIIDLSDNASQPMHSKDGRYTIVFNGEIYNYIELKEELIKQGIQFKSDSDTEVLLQLYSQKGADCLNDLDGMFAFAIWDEQTKQLFCARDRFGEKPFYYSYQQGKKFVFASEMKALWKVGVSTTFNNKMVYRYVNDKYYLQNNEDLSQTFFQDIYQIEPGHFLTIDASLSLSKRKYWDLNYRSVNNEISFDDAVEEFKHLFTTSVGRRLRSDVPVGSSLSGGLDSSSIVCTIHQYFKPHQHTFSARFPGYEKDEGKYIDKVLQKTGVKGYTTYPDSEKFIDEISCFVYHQEEPTAGASQYAQWEVMKLAKQHGVIVLLDGQGADESVTGYNHYFNYFLRELHFSGREDLLRLEQKSNTAIHNRIIPETAYNFLPDSKQKVSKSFMLSPVLKSLWLSYRAKGSFFTKDFLMDVLPEKNTETYIPATLNEMLWYDATRGNLQTLLRYSDRNSMAFSREVRLPFLNHKLIEFLFTLPPEFKIHNGWSKYIMRKSMEQLLPEEICWRKDKIGYEPPQQDWFASSKMKDKLHNAQDILKKEGIVNKRENYSERSRDWQVMMLAEMMCIGSEQ